MAYAPFNNKQLHEPIIRHISRFARFFRKFFMNMLIFLQIFTTTLQTA